MKSGYITIGYVWLNYINKSYILNYITINYKQKNIIMNSFLPKVQVKRHYPWEIIYGRIRYRGWDIETIQEKYKFLYIK